MSSSIPDFSYMIALLEKNDINHPDVLKQLERYKDIYKDIFLDTLKEINTSNVLDFRINYSYMKFSDTTRMVNKYLLNNREFALYCVKRNGYLLENFKKFFSDRSVVLAAISSDHEHNHGFYVIEDCSDISENSTYKQLQKLYGSDGEFIKILVRNTPSWILLRRNNPIKEWVTTEDQVILDFIKDPDNYSL